MKNLNACRKYLQVVYISDMTSSNGTEIQAAYYTGNKQHPTYRKSKWNWPRRPRPPETSWRNWKRALHQTILVPRKPILIQPLTQWKFKPPHQKWKQYVDEHYVTYKLNAHGHYSTHQPMKAGKTVCHYNPRRQGAVPILPSITTPAPPPYPNSKCGRILPSGNTGEHINQQ